MVDVLLARAGFVDDTAVLRLHHEAGVQVRTHPGGLPELLTSNFSRDGRGIPTCIAFTCDLAAVQDGRELSALRALRHKHRRVVFVAILEKRNLSGTERSTLCVALFDAGVDEVVSATIEPMEYAARIGASVRRRGWMELDGRTTRLQPGQRPRLDVERRRLLGSSGAQELTAKECIVMRVLLESDGLATRAHIGECLWTDGWYGTMKAIDMHMVNLRKKLRNACGSDWAIETVRGAGFLLVPGEALAPSRLSG